MPNLSFRTKTLLADLLNVLPAVTERSCSISMPNKRASRSQLSSLSFFGSSLGLLHFRMSWAFNFISLTIHDYKA